MTNSPINTQENALVVFKEKAIRRTWHNEQWWFVISDVIAALTDSVNPSGYLKDMRRRSRAKQRVGANCHPPFS